MIFCLMLMSVIQTAETEEFVILPSGVCQKIACVLSTESKSMFLKFKSDQELHVLLHFCGYLLIPPFQNPWLKALMLLFL